MTTVGTLLPNGDDLIIKFTTSNIMLDTVIIIQLNFILSKAYKNTNMQKYPGRNCSEKLKNGILFYAPYNKFELFGKKSPSS
jgi:hypothetical protein